MFSRFLQILNSKPINKFNKFRKFSISNNVKSNAFFQNHSSIPTSKIIKSNQIVSRLGFGSYRINLKEIEYQNALEHAIKSGINVIDTSANFESGESEEAIGSVLENMFKNELVSREDLVVISKAGYFETSNIESLDNSFAKVTNNSAHSITPEFLMDQINQSLKRLKLNKLDIFMLNNPERMMQAKNKQYSINNLYNDIKHAFHYLDSEVTRGRIKGYGICSNTMANPDAIDHISLPTILERLPESSKQNFIAVQVPFNLFERDAIQEFQESSLAQYAKFNDIFLFTNRPLYSITRGGIRPLVNTRNNDISYERITNDLADEFQIFTQLETELNESYSVIDLKITSKFIWSQILSENLNKLSQNYFSTKYYIEKQVKPNISNALELLSNFIVTNKLMENNEKLKNWITQYQLEVQKITNLIISYAYFNLLSMNNDLDSILSTISPSLLLDDDNKSQLYNSPLSVKALRILLANSSIGCILVGMRNINYVNDSILALKLSDDDFLTVESLKDIYNCSLLQ
ncbi:hypothetical protein Glove_116g40 [Diversispora epigaea]|uniref:NADP-dependent oxidoreductase domain-containing protein n=1 Tax=Diversispora epigaea TaxID=1348612 RepID=A0A397J0Y2_9GLOM|nr:hypothetical protein Glove_116g40 [Diversispora epigaea]